MLLRFLAAKPCIDCTCESCDHNLSTCCESISSNIRLISLTLKEAFFINLDLWFNVSFRINSIRLNSIQIPNRDKTCRVELQDMESDNSICKTGQSQNEFYHNYLWFINGVVLVCIATLGVFLNSTSLYLSLIHI